MDVISVSALVKHVSLGIGKVIAVEKTAVHVFFPDSNQLSAAKLRWPAAGAMLTTEGVAGNSWLRGLTSFAFDARSGRYTLTQNFLSHDEAVAQFLQIYPAGFLDARYVGGGTGKEGRAAKWRAANAEWMRALGGGEAEGLLADDNLAELVRRTLGVTAHVSRIPGVIDLDSMAEALEPGDVARRFFEVLLAVISTPGPARARQERLFAASEGLGVAPDAAWPIATLLPFVAQPEHHVLLVPKQADAAAVRLGRDLKLKPRPSWATYTALGDLSAQLLEKLRPLGARDFIDVEGFLHTMTTTKGRGSAPRRRS